MCKAPCCEADKAFSHQGSSRRQDKYTENYKADRKGHM